MRFCRLLALLSPFIPGIASAHEVYVLPPSVFSEALAAPRFGQWQVVMANLHDFVFWGFIAGLLIFIVFFASVSRLFEKVCNPLLAKLPRYAPLVGRIAIGLSFLAAAYFQELMGPELPLAGTFGPASGFVAGLLVLIGLMFMLGFYVRLAALAGLVLFAFEVAAHGYYMLTYTNYAGELILLLILGAHAAGYHSRHDDERKAPRFLLRWKKKLAPYAFLIVRLAFGTSLLFASLYAKVIHDNLALAVTTNYPAIASFFGFEPHFLVLGAAIVEIIIAVFFILGIEIRFTSLFLLFWLSLSLWYFGEVVWPHLILIGLPIGFIFYGYDEYTLEGRFFKKGHRPVL